MVVNFIIAMIIMAVGTWRPSKYNHPLETCKHREGFSHPTYFFLSNPEKGTLKKA